MKKYYGLEIFVTPHVKDDFKKLKKEQTYDSCIRELLEKNSDGEFIPTPTKKSPSGNKGGVQHR